MDNIGDPGDLVVAWIWLRDFGGGTSLIHILIVVAVIVLIYNLVSGRRGYGSKARSHRDTPEKPSTSCERVVPLQLNRDRFGSWRGHSRVVQNWRQVMNITTLSSTELGLIIGAAAAC